MSRLTLQGAALFAFIPVVLVLYLQLPLGPAISLGLGLVLMFGHRFVAGPWMTAHSRQRCLWCGRTLGDSSSAFVVRASGAERAMAACDEAHKTLAARFLTFAARARAPIAAGIFIPLLILLAGNLALAIGRPFIAHAANVLQFRSVVALTVVSASVGYLAVPRAAETVTSPFPLHNLFLLGIRNTLWVFRIVGIWWLILSARALAGLAG